MSSRLAPAVVIAGTSVLVAASAARASLVFDNGSPAEGVDLAFSDPDSGYMAAEDFVLAGAHTIRGIVVYGSYFAADTSPLFDNFSVSFYDDLAGAPDGATGPLGSSDLTVISRGDTGLTSLFGTRVFHYELDLVTPQSFASGISFWASIINDTSGGVDPDDDWTWTELPESGSAALSTDGGVTWELAQSVLHFQLYNTSFVPAPGTLALLGMAGLMGTRRCRN
jgi:hypothetical protein